MKATSRSFFLILSLALQVTGAGLSFAQDQGATNAPPSSPPQAGQGMSAALSPEERAHLRKVQKQVLAADPALKAEDESLRQQRQDLEDQGASASPDERKALFAQWHEHSLKVRAAALKLDPMLAPIFVKLDAWRAAHPYPKPAGGA